VKDKMFNPFFTTKPAGEGTGLGLSISHDIIVKQHAGSIEVETEPGKFTEFKIVLPRTAACIAESGGRARAFSFSWLMTSRMIGRLGPCRRGPFETTTPAASHSL
jgi:hypothetical protein